MKRRTKENGDYEWVLLAWWDKFAYIYGMIILSILSMQFVLEIVFFLVDLVRGV